MAPVWNQESHQRQQRASNTDKHHVYNTDPWSMSIGDHLNTVNKFNQYTANGTSTSDETKQQEQRQAVRYPRYYTGNSLENEAIRRQG